MPPDHAVPIDREPVAFVLLVVAGNLAKLTGRQLAYFVKVTVPIFVYPGVYVFEIIGHVDQVVSLLLGREGLVPDVGGFEIRESDVVVLIVVPLNSLLCLSK